MAQSNLTESQLRRIIRKGLRRALNESIADDDILDDAIMDVSFTFGSRMRELYHEQTGMFDGHSTEDEWSQQVDSAESALAEEIRRAVMKVEGMLHEGQFYIDRGDRRHAGDGHAIG